MTRHVVFGTGQVGRLVVGRLVAGGADVVAVNRSGRGYLPGAEVVGGDATDPRFTARVCAGADVVYFCLNAPDYTRWAEDFPPLQRGVLAGAEAAGARLVVLENLYAYGPTGGRDLTESLPARPTSAKSATRAAMTEDLLAAHRAGRVEVAAGRTTLRLLGLVRPPMREYLHTLYQFTDPWVVDDSRFRAAFGDLATPLDDALAATLAWYRDAASPSAPSSAPSSNPSASTPSSTSERIDQP